MSLGTLTAVLAVDSSRFTNGIKSALGGLATVGAAAGAAATALGAIGLKGAIAGEQAAIAFETMLGSAQEAGAFLDDLRAFAASTPFEFPELQTAASSLISAGIEAGRVIPIMTSLGNATSGMGTGAEGVKRATVALQQMSAAGRITGEDLNQLRDAGVPVFDLLAAATGKTKEAVAALAQSGKLGKTELGQLFEALETGRGLERFNGLMEKQSASLGGMLSTLKDNVTQTMTNLVEPALPTIKQGLGVVTGLLDEVPGIVDRYVLPAGRRLAGVFRRDVVPAARLLAEGFRTEVLPALRTAGEFVVTEVLPRVQQLAGYVRTEVVPVLLDLGEKLRDGVGLAVQVVTEKFEANRPEIEKFVSNLKTAAQFIVEEVVPVLSTVLGAAVVGVGVLIGGTMDLIGGLMRGIQDAIDKITEFLDKFDGLRNAVANVPGFEGLAVDQGVNAGTDLSDVARRRLADQTAATRARQRSVTPGANTAGSGRGPAGTAGAGLTLNQTNVYQGGGPTAEEIVARANALALAGTRG